MSVLSNLVFYTLTMGVESYLVLNLSIYGPMLPITIAQTLWDTKFDRTIGSLEAYSFRGTLGFAISFLSLLGMPFINSLKLLLLVSLFLGMASAILHGMLKQMASFIYPHCGRLAAAVAAGMQASALPVLGISLRAKFGRDSNRDGIKMFYFSVAFVLLFCWSCFQRLVSKSVGVDKGMKRKDSYFLLLDQTEQDAIRTTTDQPADKSFLLPLHTDLEGFNDDSHSLVSTRNDNEALLEYDNERLGDHDSESVGGYGGATGEELSAWELWHKTKPACLVLIITVASSMSVACWLNRVKSENETNKAFAQVLFYIRLLGDLFGRPATLLIPPTSIADIVLPACIRVGFVPIFFLYTMTDLIPKSDNAAICGIFIFAFTSGYLATLTYQLAPLLLHEQERERHLTKQAGLINICFSASILIGFGLTFALESLVHVA